jgi:hypothetical protein
MKIEPQSKAEERVLKRVRLSQHWTERFVAPIVLWILPLVFLIGGVYLWRIGRQQADTYVVCIDTGKQLVPCPEIPPFSYFPCAFFFIMGYFLTVEAWLLLFLMRERKVMSGILARIEMGDTERTPDGSRQPGK